MAGLSIIGAFLIFCGCAGCGLVERISRLPQADDHDIGESRDRTQPSTDKVQGQTQCQGVLWSYGSGVPGNGNGELWTPHMVEDLGEGKLLIAEQTNCSVIILDKETGEIVWQFGERGTAGNGARLTAPTSAHQLPSGPYKGDIIVTEWLGDHRVLIVDYKTKEIVWEYDGFVGPLDAIYWDDEHVMVSDCIGNRIARIRLSDRAVTWEYAVWRPFYLQKLIKHGSNKWEYGNSYGGDLLFGRIGGSVYEIDTSNSSVRWSFGEYGHWFPMLADALNGGVRAFRWGSGEDESDMRSPITIIADEGNARILAVNYNKDLLWEIGGVSEQYYRPVSWLIEPTYVTNSRNGNLLICDAMGDRIYEVAYPPLSQIIGNQRKFTTAILARSSLGASESTGLNECGLLSLRGVSSLALTVECAYDRLAVTGIAVHLYASYNGTDWDTVELKTTNGVPVFGDMPFTPGSIERKTIEIPFSPLFLKPVIENKDSSHEATNIRVVATVGR